MIVFGTKREEQDSLRYYHIAILSIWIPRLILWWNIPIHVDWLRREKQPLIITTNLPLVQMESEKEVGKYRIYDQILEMCIPMKMDGDIKRENL